MKPYGRSLSTPRLALTRAELLVEFHRACLKSRLYQSANKDRDAILAHVSPAMAKAIGAGTYMSCSILPDPRKQLAEVVFEKVKKW